ncbi:MAG: SOS response-associated peptidase [Gammaproteobacteria bacterium]|nr:SOS response-associated peptidase [Gammaproteobacteria bacterium]
MCGRFSILNDEASLAEHFALIDSCQFRTSYNVTPSSEIPIVRLSETNRKMTTAHWGFVPHWAKDDKFKPINARAETVASKPFFRGAFKKKRCLIPASGFYEWQGAKGEKQPYYIKPAGSDLFAFAGLWDHWDSPDKSFDSCTIITTTANKTMAPIHSRMPVIIDPGDYDDWLAKGNRELLKPYEGAMEAWPVSKSVNSPKHDGPELIERTG